MLDFGEMHKLTALFVVLELMMLSVQLHFYLMWPNDKCRLTYLILLGLLVIYNVTGGFFPDPNIHWLPVTVQNIMAYGSGFFMGAYFPYYFYISFELKSLKFHALYGTSIFLLLPYLIFFVVLYPVLGDLEFALNYGMIIPTLYSPILLYAMFRSIWERFNKSVDDANTPINKLEVLAVYWAVSPWVFMSVFAVLHVPQWIEVLFTNTGFVIIALLFFKRSPKLEREQRKLVLKHEAILRKQQDDFEQTCKGYGLSERETEVALKLCQGLTYKTIAEALNISPRTVDTHAQNIFLKTGVNKKINLQHILGFGG